MTTEKREARSEKQEAPTRRRLAGLVAMMLAATSWACADKVLNPRYSMSPKLMLQLVTTGIPLSQQAGAGPKMIVAVAAYTHDIPKDASFDKDSFVVINFVSAIVKGTSEQISLPVDLSGCLADPTRRGSRSGCSLYVAVALRDSGSVSFSTDSSNNSGDPFYSAYDMWLQGPIEAAPGQPPVLPPIDLSVSRYAVHQWMTDEALRLGGWETPTFFSGPITGIGGGTSPTLLAVTQGGCNVGQLAIFENGKWRRVPSQSAQCPFVAPGTQISGPWFNDVAAFSTNDVYIAGVDGLYHYDGTAITAVSAVRDQLRSVAVVTASGGGRYLVAGAQNGGVWFGNLTTFQKYALPSGQTVDQVCINGPTEAFAASSSSSGIYRFDGSSWIPTPLGQQGNKFDLQCVGGQAWVNSPQPSAGPFFKWSGGSWLQVPSTGLGNFRGYYFGVSSPTEAWAVGDSSFVNRAFYRFDGTSWREIARRQAAQAASHRLWASSAAGGGAAYVATAWGRVDRVDASGVKTVSYQPSMRDAIMTSATSAFAVGAGYFLARWDGTRWNVDAAPSGTSVNRVLQGVWSDGPGSAWAVGTASTITRWENGKWILVSDSLRPVASRDSYHAVWGAGGSVWIAGDASILRCTAVTSCASDPVPGSGPLYGIWASSPTNVFAVGAGGRILHFDGTSWTTMSSPTSFTLKRVWGMSPTSVFALGDSAIVRYDGTSWKNIPIPNGMLPPMVPPNDKIGVFHLGLWAAGPNDIYIGTQARGIMHFNGFDWSDMIQGWYGRVVAIAGYAGGCAIAVTDGTGAANLMRGVGPTGCLRPSMGAPLTWP